MQEQSNVCTRREHLGYVDWYCVDDKGNVDSIATTAKREAELRARTEHYPIKSKTKMVSKTTGKKYTKERRKVVSPVSHPGRSGLFTANSKTRSPSWSMPTGPCCPRVFKPVHEMIQKLKDEEGIVDPQVLVKRLMKKIPKKCWGCYAKINNYAYAEPTQAQLRRYKWFSSSEDSHVIDTLDKAIKKAGREVCETHEHTTKKVDGKVVKRPNRNFKNCTFKPGVPPEYVRLFDSGDFHDARAIRIWNQVAQRNPDIKFWAPTSTYIAPGDKPDAHQKEMHEELVKLNELPNVAVRPSGFSSNEATPDVPGLAAGASIVDTPETQAFAHRNKELTKLGKVERMNADLPSPTGPVTHYICPGDCTYCRACWRKDAHVAYVKHGAADSEAGLIDLTRRALLDLTPPDAHRRKDETKAAHKKRLETQRRKWARIAHLAESIVVDSKHIGPNGHSGAGKGGKKVRIDWTRLPVLNEGGI